MARLTRITLDEAQDKARAWDPDGHKDRAVFWSNNGDEWEWDLECLTYNWDTSDCEPRAVELNLCVHQNIDVYDVLERYYAGDPDWKMFEEARVSNEARRLQTALDALVAAYPMWREVESYEVLLTSDEVKMLVGWEG